MHSLSADFGDYPTLGLGDQRSVESIGAAEEEWVLAHRVDDPLRNLLASRRSDGEA